MKTFVWFNATLEQSGGGERLSLETVRSLRELGFCANYITYYYDSKATFDHMYDHLHPITLGGRPASSGGKLIGIFRRLKRLAWLRREIRKLNPDYVIVSGTWGHVVDVYLATLFSDVKYVTHIFGSMFAFPPEKEALKYGSIFRNGFNEVRLSVKSYQDVVPPSAPKASILTIAYREINSYIKYCAVRASRVLFVLSERNRWETQKLYCKDSIVLQGAFPARIFDYTPHRSLKQDLGLTDNQVILSVGRLAANKRVDLAIRSFAEIIQEKPDVHLVIGGTGPEGESLKSLAKELGVIDRVQFIGYVPEAILWDYLADCDVFLHLDLADFDIAPLEALAMGANVVWGHEMDLPDLSRQLTCLWSVTPEPAAIADATIRAIDIGKGAMPFQARRKILEAYSWESYAKRMVGYIEATSVVSR
jgi:glycosyltransferase involved in cell wall biosynthesis